MGRARYRMNVTCLTIRAVSLCRCHCRFSRPRSPRERARHDDCAGCSRKTAPAEATAGRDRDLDVSTLAATSNDEERDEKDESTCAGHSEPTACSASADCAEKNVGARESHQDGLLLRKRGWRRQQGRSERGGREFAPQAS